MKLRKNALKTSINTPLTPSRLTESVAVYTTKLLKARALTPHISSNTPSYSLSGAKQGLKPLISAVKSVAVYTIKRAIWGLFWGGLVATLFDTHYLRLRMKVVKACYTILINGLSKLRPSLELRVFG